MPEETRQTVVEKDVTGTAAETAIRDWVNNNLAPAADTDFETSGMTLDDLSNGMVTIHFGEDDEGSPTTKVRGNFSKAGEWSAT